MIRHAELQFFIFPKLNPVIMKKIVYVLFGILLLLVAIVSYISIVLPNVGRAPDLQIAITPGKVDRGHYLSWHVMMCADCHSQRDFSLFSGPPHPGTEFVGGDVFDESVGLPGRFVSGNITPVGIGEYTDGELFRVLTTGVTRDGRPLFPIMPYLNFGQLDAEDIKAVIAYLRTLDAVDMVHPPSEVGFPFSLILRTLPKKAQLQERPAITDRIAYGHYVYTAASCGDCHTNMEKGRFVGPEAGGGREFMFPDGRIVRAPNLTPHPTGMIYLNRSAFIHRFTMYAQDDYELPAVGPDEFQTIMPWHMYAKMTDEDLGAIHDFLSSLEPYENVVERFSLTAK